MTKVVIGLDIGTSSTKVVAVDAGGAIVASARADHSVDNPRPGWFEQDAEAFWWDRPAALLRDLAAALDGRSVAAVAVSGMGPCLVPCDAGGSPLRKGILYGIDSRAQAEVEQLTAELGAERILERGGSALSSQAVGPKLLWLRNHEPEVWRRTTRWFNTSSFLVERLTGRYVLDHHTASQCDPLYDLAAATWAQDWAELICPGVPLPQLFWSDEIVGGMLPEAAARTGLPAGTPVLAGTVDAWAEAHSVGVRHEGDLMLMYGSTMFLVGVDAHLGANAGLWRTRGVTAGTSTLAAGMATSGLVAAWVSDTTGRPIAELAKEAEQVPPGSDGLTLLPYFAGERSPLFDAGARGVAIGLTLAHTPGHLLRATYEGVALGVRHNLEAFDRVRGAATDWRIVAVGGGTAGTLWPQIISDVTGRKQIIPKQTVGAAYGDALLAATAVGLVGPGTDWTETEVVVEPEPMLAELYDRRYGVYRDLYPATRALVGRL